MISIIVTAFFVFLFIFWSIKPIPPCQGISFRGEAKPGFIEGVARAAAAGRIDEKLEELKKLAEKASHGPWYFAGSDRNTFVVINKAIPPNVTKIIAYCPWENDAQYLELANPKTILDLLADREQLREALKTADIYYADDKSRTEIIREALKKSDEVENG